MDNLLTSKCNNKSIHYTIKDNYTTFEILNTNMLCCKLVLFTDKVFY